MLLPLLPVWLLSAAPKDPAELERDVPEPIDAHGELADAVTAAITAVDLVGVFFFAISGAVLAVRKGYDIVGSLLLALMVGTGGGVVRDLVVGRDVPAAFDNPWYLILPAVASLAVFLRIFDGERGHHAVMAFDAIGLAVYCVVGTRIALLAGLSPVAAAVLGLVTAVGGGILRDVVAGEPPAVFGGRGWYALPAILGAGTTAALGQAEVLNPLTSAAVMVLVLVLRVVSLRREWLAPGAEISGRPSASAWIRMTSRPCRTSATARAGTGRPPPPARTAPGERGDTRRRRRRHTSGDTRVNKRATARAARDNGR